MELPSKNRIWSHWHRNTLQNRGFGATSTGIPFKTRDLEPQALEYPAKTGDLEPQALECPTKQGIGATGNGMPYKTRDWSRNQVATDSSAKPTAETQNDYATITQQLRNNYATVTLHKLINSPRIFLCNRYVM
jgi:hypothetical protein